MAHENVEIKARCSDPDGVREVLRLQNGDFRGIDHQIDTYFKVPKGRLKLREGNIEGALIYYDRADQEGPKQSDVALFEVPTGSSLREVLVSALEVLVVVDKRREIVFIGNVKFHIDEVEDLGSFVEIEAIDKDGNIGTERLNEQCQYYIDLLGIRNEDLEAQSYSDLLLARRVLYDKN